jgi:hypothetical protein
MLSAQKWVILFKHFYYMNGQKKIADKILLSMNDNNILELWNEWRKGEE